MVSSLFLDGQPWAFLGIVGGRGGVINHIKTFELHLIEDQRELLTEGPQI